MNPSGLLPTHLLLSAPRAQHLPAWTHLHTRAPRYSGCKLLFWLQSGYVSAPGLGTRKGNFCIIRGGHSRGPLSYCLATGTSWQQGWHWDKEHGVILGGAAWPPLTLGTAGPMSYLPHT